MFFCVRAALTGVTGQQQEEERLIEKRSDFSPPVKITLVKTKKRAVKFEEKFLDDDQWLKGLTVRLANASGKTVTSIDVEMTFTRPENQVKEPPAIWHLFYGFSPLWFKPEETIPPPQVKPILPGDTTEITLLDKDFEGLNLFLKQTKYAASIKKIELRVIAIGFSDGTVWNGRMLRRDPKAPKGWIPIESEREKSHGSARNRTAELFGTEFKEFDGLELWALPKNVWTKPRPLQSDCGIAITSTSSCSVQAGYDCRYSQAELSYSATPTDALEFSFEPCLTTINRVVVNCGGEARPSTKKVQCSIPSLGASHA
jgi:hypothetical protein